MFFLFSPPTRDEMPPSIRSFMERDHVSWSEMEAMLNAFREIKPDLTVGTLMTFMYIARRTAGDISGSNINIKQVSDALGMNYQSAARHCDLLSEGVGPTQGLGWIEKTRHPNERGKNLALSYAGLDVLMQVIGRLSTFPSPRSS